LLFVVRFLCAAGERIERSLFGDRPGEERLVRNAERAAERRENKLAQTYFLFLRFLRRFAAIPARA
jgi:hypothetical protein